MKSKLFFHNFCGKKHLLHSLFHTSSSEQEQLLVCTLIVMTKFKSLAIVYATAIQTENSSFKNLATAWTEEVCECKQFIHSFHHVKAINNPFTVMLLREGG